MGIIGDLIALGIGGPGLLVAKRVFYDDEPASELSAKQLRELADKKELDDFIAKARGMSATELFIGTVPHNLNEDYTPSKGASE